MTKSKLTPEQQIAGIVQRLANNLANNDEGISYTALFRLSEVLLNEIDNYTSTKETEAHLISMLKSIGGYFADEFTADEIGMIRSNIADDFPIFLGTNVSEERHNANNALSELANLQAEVGAKNNTIEALSGDKDRMEAKLTNLLHDLIRNDGVIDLNKHYTKEAIIIARLQEQIEMLETEKVHRAKLADLKDLL